MRRHRDNTSAGWAHRLLRALRAFDGVYEPEILDEIKKFGGSQVYARLVAMKCRGTTSLLRDVYLGPQRPWGLEPSSDPPIPPDILQSIDSLIKTEIAGAVQAHVSALHAAAAHRQGVGAVMSSQGMVPQGVSPQPPTTPGVGNVQGVQGLPGGVSPVGSPAQGQPTQGQPTQGQPTQGQPSSGPLQPPSAGVPSAGIPPPPPPPPPMPDVNSIRDRITELTSEARNAAKRNAAKQAKIAEDKVQEYLAMGGFYTSLAEFLVDLPIFPYGVMKGPTVRVKTVVQWQDQTPTLSPAMQNLMQGGNLQDALGPQTSLSGSPQAIPTNTSQNTLQSIGTLAPGTPAPGAPGDQANDNSAAGLMGSTSPTSLNTTQLNRKVPQLVNIPVLCWDRVSPFDIYWTPGVGSIEDASIIERTRLTRKELNDLLDLPGYNIAAIRAVLDDYGRGGLVDNWDQTDAERAILESRENPRFNQSGLIACLEFQGYAQGVLLLAAGIDPDSIADPLREYFIQAWLIGRYVIKVQLSPSPRKRHQYYVTSFEKVPGTVVGNGLPDLLTDISTVANATLRALVNNMSIASGPQVTVNNDRLADDEDGEDLYPWKRWHVKSDPFGDNSMPAISFWQAQSNSQELMAVYTAFSSLADELSAIPKFIQGQASGPVGRTASGMALLMQNSSKILQTVAANVDRDVIKGIIENLLDMIMLTDTSGLLTGEEKVRVLGVDVAMEHEMELQKQLQFLQLTANPIDMGIIGPKGRAIVLKNVADNLNLPGADIVPSEEELADKEKAQQAAQQGLALGQQSASAAMGGARGNPHGAPGGVPGQAQKGQSPGRGQQARQAQGAQAAPTATAQGPRLNAVGQQPNVSVQGPNMATNLPV